MESWGLLDYKLLVENWCANDSSANLFVISDYSLINTSLKL